MHKIKSMESDYIFFSLGILSCFHLFIPFVQATLRLYYIIIITIIIIIIIIINQGNRYNFICTNTTSYKSVAPSPDDRRIKEKKDDVDNQNEQDVIA